MVRKALAQSAPDARIRLIAARSREGREEESGYVQAAVAALRQAMQSAEVVLQEPLMSFRIDAPMEFASGVIADLTCDSDGRIDTFAGTGERGYSGDGGPAVNAAFHEPSRIRLDPRTGTLYVTDTRNHVIRRITPDGMVSTVAGVSSSRIAMSCVVLPSPTHCSTSRCRLVSFRAPE